MKELSGIRNDGAVYKLFPARIEELLMKHNDVELSQRNKKNGFNTKVMIVYHLTYNGVKKRNDLLKGLTPNNYWDKHVRDYIATQGFYEYELEESARFITIQEKEQKSVLQSIKNIPP